MSDRRTRLEALSEAQRQLLARRLEAAGEGTAPGSPVLRGYVEADESKVTPESLRSALAARLPEYMVPSSLMVLASLPRTPGGKVDRHALPPPESTAGSSTRSASLDATANEAEAALLAIWRGVLGIDEIGVHDDFFELGGDSILSIRLIARANEAGWKVAPEAFFDNPTIAGMIAVAETVEEAPATEAATSVAAVPLTPIAHWFFEHVRLDPQQWNQAVVLEVPAEVTEPVYETALSFLVRRHDALRLRFLATPVASSSKNAEARWSAEIVPPGDAQVHVETLDVSELEPSRHAATVDDLEARLHASLRLETCPLLRAAHITRGPDRKPWLLLVLHHLVVDGVSWRLLLEELERVARDLAGQRPVALPPAGTTFAAWTTALAEAGRRSPEDWGASYWTAPRRLPPPLPVDRPGSPDANTRGDARTVVAELPRERTRALLRDAPGAYRTQVNDLLLAGLLLAGEGWSGSSSLWVSVEGHGRESWSPSLDISRCVGWFTSVYPLLLELPASASAPSRDPGDVIKAVKEQLRAVPQNGIGHGVLLHLSGDESVSAALRSPPEPEVIFNYYGQRGSTDAEGGEGARTGAEASGDFASANSFRHLRDAGPSARSAREPRPCLLEIDAVVDEGIFRVQFTYSPQMHHESTIETLASAYTVALESLIDHCASSQGGVTPSDFPLAGLEQGDLDRIAGLLDDDEDQSS